ncbi:pleiotropic drug resistance protein 3-like isoform X2 [Mangifera indica]|uniref:pleiotropic drug resistance protein 3-like isoform X2 n=1 Tax=Mangifera indica TaxID=29780 RepID=UPI001CFAC346|nr:pleiotropic drug resistance protein 3-like isoform X2 [Mangifera indica]
MAQMVGSDDIESLRIELAEIGRSLRSSFRRQTSNFRSGSVRSDNDADIEYAMQWATIERLPTYDRLKSSLFDVDTVGKSVVDVTKLDPLQRHTLIEKLIKHTEHDNLKLLKKIRARIDKVGVELPSVELRFKNLGVDAECEIVQGKPLPTLWNSVKSSLSVFSRFPGTKSKEAKINIINDISGIIKPGRITLLLGPPGCGKTTLLKALSGNLDKSLEVAGEISYNSYRLDEFVPQKTSAYISQEDLHIAEMTVRETLDFSARCQGIGSRADIMLEVSRREKEAGIVPNPDVDTYMKATSVEGLKRTLQTDYVLKILGLDICADTMVGDVMRRGISGGQKKRLTTGEMIVGPTKVLMMDEISNGLDSSTAYQIVACLQQMVHITDATGLISLLQPAPETFELFDDIILMTEGKIVYQGPRDKVIEFFEDCGFRCPERKGVADFLQEVISKKDQAQYWYQTEDPYHYIPVDVFCQNFKESSLGKKLYEDLSVPFDNSKSQKNALSFDVYSLSKWQLLKACMSREFLLMKRNFFLYAFKTIQIIIIALITMTVFIRTRMDIDVLHASYYMGALFFGLVILLVDGIPELSMTTQRLPVFYKQRDLRFYPAWAYAIPTAILKVPLSLIESVVWTCLTYYVIGYTPEASRFFRQLILLFAVHLTSLSMFRFVASVCKTVSAAMTAGGFGLLLVMIFGGFIIKHPSMPVWLKWGFWVSPLTYAEIGVSGNEFLAPRWQKMVPSNATIGKAILDSRGLNYEGYFLWISLGALFGFALLFNFGFVLALSFLKPPGSSRTMISREKFAKIQRRPSSNDVDLVEGNTGNKPIQASNKGRMVLPFQPLTLTFQNMNYFVDTPLEMREQGFADKKLQLLSDATGALRPGVLTALMGISGAGKTTLFDVLAGRKTTGYIEGDIKIGGYPKVQETFARISGYCEQTDVHSPRITVGESLMFSAWLRLSPEIDSKTKAAFVNEVLEIIELDEIKDSLVGLPGDGLSTEQRKRLTIAVELVANPSIIFMDEPTTGLDARAAAIVMRVVKNVVETGRTIVCTIHQPSIDIFEAFDELILLKRGGRVVYSGELGRHSSKLIEYFQRISGVTKIKDNYNPATWILELTSPSAEAELNVDFAEIYKDSVLNEKNKELVRELSFPLPDSTDLHFPTRFSQNFWGQFKKCLWKQYLSYWRSPSYNLHRITHVLIASVLFGVLFWNQGRNMNDQQSLFNIFGALYVAVIFLGINNCSSVMSYVATERTVMYREKFAGMYSPRAYAFAQVAVEIPYIFVQAILFVLITYPMMGFYWSVYKIFWNLYAMFMTMLYYNYLGMLLVALTPNEMVAAILSSVFYTLFNLFSGFVMPQPQIPKWWIWLYYLTPTSWTLNAMITSQYGDISKEITVFGESVSVSSFIKDYFGFRHDRLAITGVVLVAFPLFYASLFAYLIGRLNFLRR